MEIWNCMIGFEGKYEVSNEGRVRSIDRIMIRSNGRKKTIHGKILNPSLVRGYPVVLIRDSNGVGIKKVHRLVAESFIPNPDNKKTVNHINGVKTDNRVINLEWATYSENHKHAYKNGLMNAKKGESHKRSVLTENQAKEIKYGNKGMLQKDIAEIYGVSKTLISLIRLGKNWGHI